MFAFAAKQAAPVAKQSTRVINRVLVFMGQIKTGFQVLGNAFLSRLSLGKGGSFATSKNPLLHVCDLYDTALSLRVLWIFHHRHVQFFLAFAERDVCCAITGGDLKYV